MALFFSPPCVARIFPFPLASVRRNAPEPSQGHIKDRRERRKGNERGIRTKVVVVVKGVKERHVEA